MTKIIIDIIDFNFEEMIYSKIQFKMCQKTITIKEKYTAIQIDPSFLDSILDFFYIEEIYFVGKEYKTKPFYVPIYINEENKLSCYFNKKGEFYFEIYYLRKKNMPDYLKLNDGKAINNYDAFGLTFIRRFNLLNCNKEDMPFKTHFPNNINGNSFQLSNFNSAQDIGCFEIIKNEPLKLNLNDLKVKYEDKIQELNIKISKVIEIYKKNKKKNINLASKILAFVNKNFEENITDLLHLIINQRKYNESFKEYYEVLEGFGIIYNIKCYKNNCRYLIDSLEDLYSCINYMNNNINDFNYSDKLIFIYSFYEIIKVEIPGKYLEENDGDDDNSIDLYSNNNFPLEHVLIFSQLGQKCAYKNAYNLYNNIINNLDENSAFLEPLFFLNSQSNENLFYSDFTTMYKLSMLSFDKIIQHLNKVVPNFIIRTSSKKGGNGQYIPDSGFIIIYEKELFNFSYDEGYKKLINNSDEKWIYSIPIFMVLIHEALAHAKLQITSYKGLSPQYLFNPYPDYNLLYQEYKGESDRLIEFHISNEKTKIQYLKFSCESLIEISDYNFWIQKDFTKLNSYLEQKMKSSNFRPKKEQELPLFPYWNLNIQNELERENKDLLKYADEQSEKMDKTKNIKKNEFESKICK